MFTTDQHTFSKSCWIYIDGTDVYVELSNIEGLHNIGNLTV